MAEATEEVIPEVGAGEAPNDQAIADQIVELMSQMSVEGQSELFLGLQGQYAEVQDAKKNSPENQAADKAEMMDSL